MTRATIRRWTFLPIGLLALSAGGCFKLARSAPPVERFVLGGIAEPMQAPAVVSRESAGLAIGIRRLDLAPYLATLDILVRRDEHEVLSTGFQRWAENPTVGINRAVAGYLGAVQGIRSVDIAPWPIRSDHDYLVQLHVTRFEGVVPGGTGAGGEARLSARWEILRSGDGVLVARGTTEHRAEWAVNDYAALVKRLDEGVVTLSKGLATCLARLGVPLAESSDTSASRSSTIECTGPASR